MTREEAVVSSGSPAGGDTNNADYHRHAAVSKSHLDQIARSPLHYWSRYLDPNRVEPEPTAAMALGSALHTHVLELDLWDQLYAIAPEGLDRRTKAGKDAWARFELEAAGKTVLTASDVQVVRHMARSIYSHKAAAFLLESQEGVAESTHMWTDDATGLQCKCRPDWLTADGSLIVDLKTTKDASPNGFARSIAQYRYHVQAAWYLNGLERATGRRPEFFIFIAVESTPPHAVGVYVADAEMIELGWQTACADLTKLAQCKAADSWPSYSEELQPIRLPGWMRPRPDGQPQLAPPHEIETF